MLETFIHLFALVLLVVCVAKCSPGEVVLPVNLPVVDEDETTVNTQKKSVFDRISEVNPETANVMPDNFDKTSSGLFEYDIVLNQWSHEVVFGPDPNRLHGAPTVDFNRLWPKGIVYYTYDDSIARESSGKTLSIIEQAIKVYREKTCITFVKRTKEDHYIEFHKGSGCWSLIGRVGGKQQISLGYGCEHVGVAIHEMLHSLGFWHEQSRPDRDKYVTIQFDNIQTGMKDQFKMYDQGVINALDSSYDYGSIMHYGDTAFSKDKANLKTIIVKDPNFKGTIGQRNGLSPIDIDQIKKLYKCSGSAVVVDGSWGLWSSWSVCDRTCGGGTLLRSRSCDSPAPSNGGKQCVGESSVTEKCNTAACPTPIECNFDQSFCLWENAANDEMNWIRLSGFTPSSGTGPSADHTTQKGSYIYIETSSPRVNGDRALLQSSTLSGVTYYRCFKFFYHMYGPNINSLSVLLKHGDLVNSVWLLRGNQGDMWHEANVPINPSQNDVQIYIMGVCGNGFQGDIALDDMTITSSYCSTNPANARIEEPTTSRPTTIATTTTTEKSVSKTETFSCNFESTSPQCQWMNVNDYDTIDWLVNTGPTNSAETGPSYGSYIYIEGSHPAVEGDKAWLLSPEVPFIASYSPKCFQFDYYMYGRGIGELNILFFNEETSTLSTYWSIKGDQGDLWYKGNVELPAGSKQRIIVEAVRGITFTSDIAIDNMKLIDGSCALKPSTAQIHADESDESTETGFKDPEDNVIEIEVTSEGCGDPTVRKKTFEKLNQSVKENKSYRGRRKPRGFSGSWKDFLKHAGEVAAKIKERKGGIYKSIVDSVNKRVVSYLQKKLDGFKVNASFINTQGVSMKTKNDCKLAKASILVNGVETSLGKPGHNVVVIDGKTGNVLYKKWYDTKSHSLAATTAGEDLQKLPPDTIIVIATQDSVLPQFIGKTELQKIGAVRPYQPGYQGSWAFIGYKGNRKVNWIKQISHARGNGPSKVSATIPLMTGPDTETPPEKKKLTSITVINNEVRLSKKHFVKVPLEWSSKLNFGGADFTVSLWFQTSKDGTIFSKVQPYLNTYSDYIKTVYIEGGFLHIKLASGKPYKIIEKVSDGLWHHLVVSVKKDKSQDSLKVYIDGVALLSKWFKTEADRLDTIVQIGKTVQKFPGNTFFDGRIKKFVYKTQSVNSDAVKKLYRIRN